MLQHAISIIVSLLLSSPLFVYGFANSTFNPIITPKSDDVARPGSTFLVTWRPTSTGLVSLFVRNEGETTGIVIANAIAASKGQYKWAVPARLAANTTRTDIFSVYQFEMRIYEGNLGKNTLDIAPFEANRTYDFSDGYFAISNDPKLLLPPPPDTTGVVETVTTSVPAYASTAEITSVGASSSGATGTANQSIAATRTPTFVSVISGGCKDGFRYWTVGVVIWGLLLGGIII